jgi:peroxidase
VLDINQCIQNNVHTSGCFLSGDERVDQNAFLTAMHTLFLRLHNHIASVLKDKNAHWNDETLFQEARRITIALYQNIIYTEFLQILLGQETMRKFGLNSLESGWSWNYDDYLYPNNFNEFATAGFRLHNLVPDSFKLAGKFKWIFFIFFKVFGL